MHRFKVTFEADGTSRRFNLEEADESETLFGKLRAKILTMVPADQDISLYWLDAGGCKILCESEEEVRIGLEECPSATNGIFELTVTPRPLRLPAPGSVTSGRIIPAVIASSPVVRVIKVPPHRERRRCVCEECGRAFKCTSHLVDHKRTHTGEKPFKCEICGNTYRHRTSLKGHMNSHTGAKPHKCTFPNCNYESAWSSYMAEHMRQMHGTRNAESEERDVVKKNRPPKAKKGRKSKKNGSIEPGITVEDPPVDAVEEKEPVTRVLRRGRRKGKDIPAESQAEKPKTRKRKNAPKKVPTGALNLNSADGQSEMLLAVRYLTDNDSNSEFPAVRVVGYYPSGVLPENESTTLHEGHSEA